ncbi:MAG: M48 family metallopeptidase, partial [Planctomycetes bacterium]|nr:M48 family metallopeptidase [Planctomycetota bacterium]
MVGGKPHSDPAEWHLHALEDDKLCVVLPEGSRTDPWRTLEHWLRDQARKDLQTQLAKRSRDMGVAFNRMYLRSQRTKWGNCSPLRNLSFNWRLVMAPPSVLDYIV